MGEPLVDAVLHLALVASTEQRDDNMTKRLQAIANKYPRLEPRDIEDYFSKHTTKGDTSEPTNSFVFLPLVHEPQLVPILSMSYDLERHEASLQAGVFPVRSDSASNPRAFADRYEQPEGSGRHDFWHAQPMGEFRLHDKSSRTLERLFGMPDDTPAFPLDAQKPVDLLVSLMISLYGLKHAGKLAFACGLQSRMTSMRCCPRPPTGT